MLGAGVAAVSITYTNVSNPAAFGVQWSTNANQYTLVNPRGITALWFGVHRDGRWITTDVIDPSRFGLTTPPTTYRDFMTIVKSYVEE
jgi:hypothetical protein